MTHAQHASPSAYRAAKEADDGRAKHDRPAGNEPGGCECMTCGVIFIGAEWHDECAVCAARADKADV